MNEKATYLVTFKFSELTKKQLEQLLNELVQNAGIIPQKVKKKEKIM